MSKLLSDWVCGSIKIVAARKVLISIVILSALLSLTQLTASQSDKISAGAEGNNISGECNVPESNTSLATPAVTGDHNVGETNGVGRCNVPEPNLRGDTLEQQINRLESQRTEPNLPAYKTKEALRAERLRKKIQDMNEAIELDEERIENLPWRLDYVIRLEEKLQLLTDQEKNYKGIINLAERYRVPGVDLMDTQKIQAEKYRILGVDVMDTKMRLIECQGRIRKIRLEMESLVEEDRQQKIAAQQRRNANARR
jgi:hypothetical protein